MPSAAKGKKPSAPARPSKSKARPAPSHRPVAAPKKADAKKPPTKVAARPAAPSKTASPKPAAPPVGRGPDARRHVLSLSFLRDGDEFMARLETDAGQITELKNRSLDQLLTLVANELEDLLE